MSMVSACLYIQSVSARSTRAKGPKRQGVGGSDHVALAELDALWVRQHPLGGRAGRHVDFFLGPAGE